MVVASTGSELMCVLGRREGGSKAMCHLAQMFSPHFYIPLHLCVWVCGFRYTWEIAIHVRILINRVVNL